MLTRYTLPSNDSYGKRIFALFFGVRYLLLQPGAQLWAPNQLPAARTGNLTFNHSFTYFQHETLIANYHFAAWISLILE